jgi:hypothetical protein
VSLVGGTYTDGYDAGLRDATEGKPRRVAPPSNSRANPFRVGYAAGYADGLARRS